jgi:hypothetical protein
MRNMSALLPLLLQNLSPEFRAILEGNGPPEDERRGLVRTRSWGDDLMDQRAVSGALESAFRHELEAMLVRRGPRHGPRHPRGGSPSRRGLTGVPRVESGVDANIGDMADEDDRVVEMSQHGNESPSLEAAVRALREEVTVLKNVIGASFDMQLDIQRSIRQEVSAAMNRPPARCLSECSHEGKLVTDGDGVPDEGSTASSSAVTVHAAHPTPNQNAYKPAVSGTCVVCLETRVDAMLYSCGHMCSCALCGRHLIASGQNCPICRAPIRDVVRVYMVAEE